MPATTSLSTARYADWKAPTGDGQTLIWPEPAALLQQTRDNAKHLGHATQVRIQNVPLPELRTRMREWIGHTDADKPLIATGHQTELYHPGVWAKHAMMDALSRIAGGDGYFFAVDTDAPKHLQLRWPGGGAPITDDPDITKADWSGRLAQPTPAHLAQLQHDLHAAAGSWDFKPAAEPFFASMTKLALEDVTLSNALTNATHALDWSLGLRHHAMLASPIFFAEPFLALAHHVCANAGEFAAAYNAALHEYRDENAIDNPGRPMPDLKVGSGACEVPLWFDNLTDGSRQRAVLVEVDGQWSLVLADDAFVFDRALNAWDAAAALGAWLRRHNLRLAPRALTLTMFFRLLLVDQFIHGIGGGRYDQVLDKLIARYFAIDPPRFSVATATLYFPGAVGQERACLPCLRLEGHQIKHRVLGEAKRELVTAIAEAPRKSLERAALFAKMHREMKAHAHAPSIEDWQHRMATAEQTAVLQRTLFDRELFYGIQSQTRLVGIIERYAEAF
ncbi:MAG TPA: hypothetical protein VGN72_07190 [Tepidisphaeraceae bacterium]|jgi:hypothetical protein|nr:hypothetical protein [Tepidisphaeraceae bacterium]